ncbi:MAG: hypothetical protein P8Y36_01590 [Alphaproteobacteria bacterium]
MNNPKKHGARGAVEYVCPGCNSINVIPVEGVDDEYKCRECEYTGEAAHFIRTPDTRHRGAAKERSPLALALQKAALAHRNLASQHTDCRVSMTFTPAGLLLIGSRNIGGFGDESLAETRFELTWAQLDGVGNHAGANAVGLVFSALLAYGQSND